MKGYAVTYQVSGLEGSYTTQVDAKDRTTAIQKTKRQHGKLWKTAESGIKVLRVSVVGYY